MTEQQRLLGANRDFTLLWVGQAFSALGSAASAIALPLLVLDAGSATDLGVLTAVSMVVRLAVMLPVGAWVDRVNKRLLMVGCNAALFITQAALAVSIVTDHASIALIIAIGTLSMPFSVLMGTAEEPAVRHVVPAEQLPLALSRNEARGAAAGLLGPPLGGVLFAISPALPFLVDAGTFVIAMACISLIRAPLPATPDARETRFVSSIVTGLKFTWQQAFLRVTLLLIAGLNLVSNALLIVALVIAEAHGHEETSGLLMTFASVGILTGALVAPKVVSRLTVRSILIANRLIWAALIPLFAVLTHPIALGLVFGVLYFIGPTGNAALTTRRMALTPDELQGRANSAAGFVSGIAAPLGVAFVGIAIDSAGEATAILTLAALMLLGGVLAALSPAVRTDGKVPAVSQAG